MFYVVWVRVYALVSFANAKRRGGEEKGRGAHIVSLCTTIYYNLSIFYVVALTNDTVLAESYSIYKV